MEVLLIYLLGWLIVWIGYYIHQIYTEVDKWKPKKLIIYKGFTFGFFSWFAIIICISICICYYVIRLNDWIEDKLSK